MHFCLISEVFLQIFFSLAKLNHLEGVSASKLEGMKKTEEQTKVLPDMIQAFIMNMFQGSLNRLTCKFVCI